jgi:phosphate:Na+ symporter
MLNITSPTMVLVGLVTGVFLLLYGVRLVSDAVQETIKGRLQQALPWLSENPFAAFGIGVVATGLLQSSSAMSSLLVELASAELVPLSVGIVILLGSNVGSTLVVQLLAFHITDIALQIVGVAAVTALLVHRTPHRYIGHAAFGFSLVILGLAIIKTASDPIAADPTTHSVLSALATAPLVLATIGVVLAMLLNSSAATIALVLPLAATGALSLTSALALMLGANVGTTLLSMFSSLSGGSLAGRRLAVTHISTKLLGATILFFLIQPLADLLSLHQLHLNPATAVALTHFAFSIVLAVIFAPFSSSLARLLEKLVPEKKAEVIEFPVLPVLDPNALGTPAVAQGLAVREILHMADIVTNMIDLGMQAFGEQPEPIRIHIGAMDDELDDLDRSIKEYLTQLGEEQTTDILLTIVGDLEAIGDLVTQRFMNLAYRRARDQVFFSEEGWKDLVCYHELVAGAFQHVFAAMATRDLRLATEFLSGKHELKQIKRDLHIRHIRRLQANNPSSQASSAIHLDLLNAMHTILSHISNIAHALQEISNSQISYTLPESVVKAHTAPLPQLKAKAPTAPSPEKKPSRPYSLHMTQESVKAQTAHIAYALPEMLVETPSLQIAYGPPATPLHRYQTKETSALENPILSTGQFVAVRGLARSKSERI